MRVPAKNARSVMRLESASVDVSQLPRGNVARRVVGRMAITVRIAHAAPVTPYARHDTTDGMPRHAAWRVYLYQGEPCAVRWRPIG